MTRVDPNLRRIDIIGAFRYRNRIIQDIKSERTVGTLSAEYFLLCSFPVLSTKALHDPHLRKRKRVLLKLHAIFISDRDRSSYLMT